ncbi:hypothetical protein [Microcystis aeruginosa]|uniref:Uncharacterized protein n=1 Tax=Microcystis aeruginosa PCC 9808 TaxID=1160284 RepID=I4HR50_MICAE|nr:hypothetical protein [Microcystis aeruginosa]CCI24524.1 hypothetical protein MICAG_2460007 [Microcystis aeruginosa PCC 9808]
MSTPYDNCFDHITDPVQRNSVRQQWLQMVCGGLSVADVRMLSSHAKLITCPIELKPLRGNDRHV